MRSFLLKATLSFKFGTIITVAAFCSITNTGLAQDFVPGQSYLDSTSYVEYIAGNLPIVISTPHGGYLEPKEIPDRSFGVFARDVYTQEVARGVYEAFFEETGCYPHVIINLLHRKKFDANREIVEAADGNPTVEAAWFNYHNFIQISKDKIEENFNRGLFLDIHGQNHPIPRIEFGYTIWGSQLRQSDETLNGTDQIEQSSIRTLVEDNLASLTHAELLRGSKSFGTLMEEKGYPSVPSINDPFPMDGDDYFSGGYNTVRHGSREGGNIDAIQIELYNIIRSDDELRAILIPHLRECISEYMNAHYGLEKCEDLNTTIPETANSSFKVYPNPAVDLLYFGDNDEIIEEIKLYNPTGQLIVMEHQVNSIDVKDLHQGIYILAIKEKADDEYIYELITIK